MMTMMNRIQKKMDEETLKTMPEFIQDLPPVVRDFIFDGGWQERTEEIAKKYSLNQSQTEILVDNVLFVLLGIDNGEDFIKLMPSELGISRLLSGQILEELETRVFEYSVKSIQNKLPKKDTEEEAGKIVVSTQKPPLETRLGNPITTPPEIRPNMLPMIEEGEELKVLEPKKHRTLPSSFWEVAESAPKEVPEPAPTVQNDTKPTESRIHYKPKDVVDEKVAQPVPVPRFNAVPGDDEAPVVDRYKPPVAPTPPRTPLTSSGISTPPSKSVEVAKKEQPETKPERKYAVDPYREPVE